MANLGAVLHGPHVLRIEERPVPVPGPAEVLVEVQAVGICGSDVHYFERGRIGDYVVEAPMVLGHESAGTVVDVGGDVDPRRVGELVALEPGVPCRHCAQCLAGRYNLCPFVVFFATPPVDGSLARFVAIDAQFAHPAPAGLSAEEAAMAEPVSVGVWAARKAGITGGDRVLVTGAGPIGLYAAQVARGFGAAAVTVTDLSEFRLDAARAVGLDGRRPDSLGDARFDVLLECSGAAVALTSAMQQLAPAGRVVLVGMGADTVSVSVPLIQERELTISGVFRYANTYPTALGMIANGTVQVARSITHRFAIDRAEDALTVSRTDPNSLKAVVIP